ncbi:hypothetical protein [Dactylosporangium sp. CS-033363]|uniref:hypothetical protein n=1 Tax=Dactylosporangium sp. CS-033363 TaxID=3239935 RepID=UPI003D8D48DF
MTRLHRHRALLATVGAAAVLTVATACSGSHPTAEGTTPPPASTAPTAAPSTAGPSPTPAASYTKPPPRNLTRPPGVGTISGSTCTYAVSSIHIFAASWASNQVSVVQRGRQVPDDVWAETARVTDDYHTGIATTRSRLKDAHIPESFPLYADLADADAAITEAITAAQAKDSSQVMPIYFKALTAEDHLVESCSALETTAR